MHFIYLKFYTYIHVLALLNLKLLTSSQFCGTFGEIDYCCDNYFYDDVNKNCIECPIGSYGKNCSKTCVKPKFGWLCYYTCECDLDECSIIHGCQNNSVVTPFSHVASSVEEAYDTPSSRSGPVISPFHLQTTEIIQTAKTFPNIDDNNSNIVVVMTISIASGVIFIWICAFTIFCCVTRRKASVYIQSTHNPPSDSNELTISPVHNLETDIYMEIEETSGIRRIEATKQEETVIKTSYDKLSKSVSDSSKYSEIGKYYTDIEKYKTFTTHRAFYIQQKLMRHRSWHHPLDTLYMPNTPKMANSYIELCDDNTYLQAIHAFENIADCKKFIYSNLSANQYLNVHTNSARFEPKRAVSYDDFIGILQ
ncbi:uncharacterized protein LOC125681569 isoform X2 [Ostrea edulis]|uniref:uncharacterized protein LOC125681569 isoform X2 n=1 Tax=Ostrea edulis TaxID=37623 RepID=UPI00209576A6|nr:uncharacterized protein LOC125681569 isoform X2 [Ostrea edulis]